MKQKDRVESGEASRCHAVEAILSFALFALVCTQAIVDLRFEIQNWSPWISSATDYSDNQLNAFYDKLVYCTQLSNDFKRVVSNVVMVRTVIMLKTQYF